jgi:hypothetical protein
MKIYLAARYGRHSEMRECRTALEALGHRVVSTWIDAKEDPTNLSECAYAALYEITEADAMICFLDGHNDWRGGNHTEFGIALAQGLKLFSVGNGYWDTNVFHRLAGVARYENVAQLLKAWGQQEEAK